MRNVCLFVASLAFLVVPCLTTTVAAGQFAVNPYPVPSPYPQQQFQQQMPAPASLPTGFKFCPAPGADNTEFNSSYYAIDARTGQMTRYMDGVPRNEPFGPVDGEEQVLFVSPPINVENQYVPYPGAAPQMPPPEFRHPPQQQRQQPQVRRRPVAAAPVARPAPQQQQRREQLAAAPARDHRAARNMPPQGRQQRDDRLPWWKKVLH